MVRLREPPKPRPPVMRRAIEAAIFLGVLGIVGMNWWQAFGSEMLAGRKSQGVVVLTGGDCVGGLCMNGESAEAIPVASAR